MTLRPQAVYLVPEETARVARVAFPRGSMFMRMRECLGMIYDDQTFAALYPVQGQPATSPFRLALTLVMQFAEHLSDRQAADAVCSRIDWKYALALELTDSGFDASVLSEFRTRLIRGSAEQRLLDTLLTLFRDQGLLKARGTQRTDSTHVLAAVRDLNRLELVGETLRAALNSLAVVAPERLTAVVPAAWYDRHAERCEEYRLPDAAAKRQRLAVEIGTDGFALLAAIADPAAPAWLGDVPAVAVLYQVGPSSLSRLRPACAGVRQRRRQRVGP
jgi:transposase